MGWVHELLKKMGVEPAVEDEGLVVEGRNLLGEEHDDVKVVFREPGVQAYSAATEVEILVEGLGNPVTLYVDYGTGSRDRLVEDIRWVVETVKSGMPLLRRYGLTNAVAACDRECVVKFTDNEHRTVVRVKRGSYKVTSTFSPPEPLYRSLYFTVAGKLIEAALRDYRYTVRPSPRGSSFLVEVEASSISKLLRALDTINEVRGVTNEMYQWLKEETMMRRFKKKEVKLTPELALVLLLGKASKLPEAVMMGYKEVTLASVVAHYLKKEHPDIYREVVEAGSTVPRSIFTIARDLKKRGVLRVDADGMVVVNGKSVVELLTGAGLPRPLALYANAAILYNLFRFWVVEWKDIERWGAVSPATVSVFASMDVRSLPVDTVLKYWDDIPEPVRTVYLSELPDRELVRLLLDESKRGLLHTETLNVIGYIRDPNLKTEMAYRLAPSLLGGGKYMLWVTVQEAAIDAGEWLVQLDRVLNTAPGGDKIFIVYRKDKMVGLLVKAPSVRKAVEAIAPVYDEVLKQVETAELHGRRLFKPYRKGSFTFYHSTFYPAQVSPDTDTIDKVLSFIEEVKRKEGHAIET